MGVAGAGHKIVVVVPNKHLHLIAVQGGHPVDVGLPAHAAGQDPSSGRAPLLVTGKRVPARLPSSLKAPSTGRLMPFVARARYPGK